MSIYTFFPLLFISITILSSCSSNNDNIELGAIYNQAAKSYSDERDPVIVIPGILGSRLKNRENGELVWGSFLGAFADPNTEEGAQLLSLPISERAEINDFYTSVHPDGVLGKIKLSFLGLPVELSAYYQVLRALGVGGYRDEELSEAGAVDYGDNHFTCFQFPYYWRRDISSNVEELDRYIKEKKAYVEKEYLKRYGVKRDVKFTLVAHSMGGLLARYYARYGPNPIEADRPDPELNWSGTKNVRRIIIVGTPNGGSIQAFNDLLYGKDLGPIVPTYPAGILGTMPAVYQILPRTRHKAYRLAEGSHVENIFDVTLWQKYRWGLLSDKSDKILTRLLPNASERAERVRLASSYLKRVLRRAERFQKLLDTPAHPPESFAMFLFLSDSKRTATIAAIDKDSGDITLTGFVPGDGLVPRSSVLLDERVGIKEWRPRISSPIKWKSVTILPGDHIGLTMDPVFIDNILFSLLEEPVA